MPEVFEGKFESGVVKVEGCLNEGEKVLVVSKLRERKIKKYYGIFRGRNVDEVIREIESGSIYR